MAKVRRRRNCVSSSDIRAKLILEKTGDYTALGQQSEAPCIIALRLQTCSAIVAKVSG